MGQVEGGDAQGPEAAEHGEDAKAQVVPRGHHEEVVLTLCVTGVVALPERWGGRAGLPGVSPSSPEAGVRPGKPSWQVCVPHRKRKTPRTGSGLFHGRLNLTDPADLWDGVWTAG